MTTNEPQTPIHPKTHSLAVLSLVLSILGVLPILPVLGGMAGIVAGDLARNKIHARPDQYTGEKLARAGIILGWVGIGLGALVVLILVGGILIFGLPLQ